MEKDTIFLLVLITAGLLSFLCFWLEGRMRKAVLRQRETEEEQAEYRRRLVSLERELASGRKPAVATRTEREEARESAFSGSLRQARLRMRLQQRRPSSAGVIERYRLVGGMARRGLSAEDISAIMQLHGSEAEQLLKLSRVAQQAV